MCQCWNMYSSQNREGSVKFWLTDKFTFSNENLAHVPFSSHWWLTGTQMSYFTLFRNFTPRHGPRWKLLGKVSIQQQKSYLLPSAAILSFSFHKTIITKSIERFSGWTQTFSFNFYQSFQWLCMWDCCPFLTAICVLSVLVDTVVVTRNNTPCFPIFSVKSCSNLKPNDSFEFHSSRGFWNTHTSLIWWSFSWVI